MTLLALVLALLLAAHVAVTVTAWRRWRNGGALVACYVAGVLLTGRLVWEVGA